MGEMLYEGAGIIQAMAATDISDSCVHLGSTDTDGPHLFQPLQNDITHLSPPQWYSTWNISEYDRPSPYPSSQVRTIEVESGFF